MSGRQGRPRVFVRMAKPVSGAPAGSQRPRERASPRKALRLRKTQHAARATRPDPLPACASRPDCPGGRAPTDPLPPPSRRRFAWCHGAQRRGRAIASQGAPSRLGPLRLGRGLGLFPATQGQPHVRALACRPAACLCGGVGRVCRLREGPLPARTSAGCHARPRRGSLEPRCLPGWSPFVAPVGSAPSSAAVQGQGRLGRTPCGDLKLGNTPFPLPVSAATRPDGRAPRPGTRVRAQGPGRPRCAWGEGMSSLPPPPSFLSSRAS